MARVTKKLKVVREAPLQTAPDVRLVMDMELLEVFEAPMTPGFFLVRAPLDRLPVAGLEEVAVGHAASLALIE